MRHTRYSNLAGNDFVVDLRHSPVRRSAEKCNKSRDAHSIRLLHFAAVDCEVGALGSAGVVGFVSGFLILNPQDLHRCHPNFPTHPIANRSRGVGVAVVSAEEHCTYAADVRRNTRNRCPSRKRHEKAAAAAVVAVAVVVVELDKDSTSRVTPVEAGAEAGVVTGAVAVAEIVAEVEVRPDVEWWPVRQPGLGLIREVAQADSAKLPATNPTETDVEAGEEPHAARDSAVGFFVG